MGSKSKAGVIWMPKVKPDQVIRHEIVLGRADRELLTDVVTAYQINRIGTPLVNLLNDNTSLILIAGILEAAGFIDIIPNWMLPSIQEGVYDTFQDFVDAAEGAGEAVEDFKKNPYVRAYWYVWKNYTIAGRVLT